MYPSDSPPPQHTISDLSNPPSRPSLNLPDPNQSTKSQLLAPPTPTVPLVNTSGTLITLRYSATSPFVFRKIPLHIPYNLARGSAVREGNPRDGSFIGDSPILMPWEDSSIYSAAEHLAIILRNDHKLRSKAEDLCALHNISLHTLLTKGPNHVIYIDSNPYTTYGNHETYPLLKAIFAQRSFAIVENRKGLARINGDFDHDFFARLLELEAISYATIVVPEGLLVPAPYRFLLCGLSVAVAVTATVLTVIYDDRTNFIERIESAVFVLGAVLLTIPAVVSLLSSEPHLIKNSIRGKRILVKQSEVSRYFRLSRRDYAMLTTRTKGSKLVSRDIGCYLTGDERGTHHGDEPVVQCEDLARFGLICGQSVHYRTNWQTVCISNRLGDNRTHLTTEVPRVRYWCAGVRPDTWVGFTASSEECA